MMEVWWALLAAIPAVLAGHAFGRKKRRYDEQKLKSARGREKSSDDIFFCERVCTSKRMLKKFGAFSKDPIRDTCFTVCGVSELDACARTVCVNQHQVPNWNDTCLRRCQRRFYPSHCNVSHRHHRRIRGLAGLQGKQKIFISMCWLLTYFIFGRV